MSGDKDSFFGADHPPPTTVGDVLFRDGKPNDVLAERGWIILVNFIAAGDQRALRQLYERTHRLVFSVIARITRSRREAERLTVEVFGDIWRRAYAYDPSADSVLSWVIGQARAKALAWLQVDQDLGGEILTPTPLWGALSRRIAVESGLPPMATSAQGWTDPDWKQVSPGIHCQILSTDEPRDRVSMLVRLDPDAEYPAHTHAGVEEVHLLQGELVIDGRKLCAGDYSRAEPGTSDARVWTETGCICIVITSPSDMLR